MIKILELFGGIGACSKALERLGIDYEIADYVEIDKYAVNSFNAMHNTDFEPQDISKWDKDIEVDLIMHGSPCQDFSLAGKQAGGDKDSGTRSSLMYETIRIVEKLKPKYVIWENVKNLLSKKHIHNFNAYLETMEQLGYKNYYQVLNAKDYGIPQNRERVFTVSILGNGNYEFPKGVENTNKIIEHNPKGRHQQDFIQDEDGLCRCIPAGTHGSTPHLLKTLVRNYEFPPKQELKLKLKDMLEDEVDEKYYLSEKMVNCFMSDGTGKYPRRERFLQNINRKNKDVANAIITTEGNKPTCNFIKNKICETRYDEGIRFFKDDICGTIRTVEAGGNKAVLNNPPLRIRKLTPKECWRLMGFDDEDFEKAAFKKETSYIEGGLKCNAKLKIVNEKQRHLDMETYALCTTNDMLDMETPIRTKRKKSIENENNEKMQNVNIAIEMLDEVEQKECVTNIIKCGENTTILYTLMEELDQHHMAIIELGKRGKANIEKYMKITLEENLNPMKLYTISILIEQIIKSKIYTCITQKANIQGNIAIIEDCVKNLKMMKLSNLKMEYITRLNSDTMLYKQAGNSICVPVLMAIFKELIK